MNGELLAILDSLEREKGIERAVLVEAIEASLLSASRKKLGAYSNVTVSVDKDSGQIKVFAEKKVVKSVQREEKEVALLDARMVNPDAKVGDNVLVEVTPRDFGRIAAQTAKQVIIQKIREAEKEVVYTRFKEKEGDITSGVVRKFDHGNVIVDLGKTEGIIPYRERGPHEEYKIGERLRAYIIEVKKTSKQPQVLMSRSHPNLVRKLFEMEVPEIFEGVVEIKAIAREAGERTKVAVSCQDKNIDSIGACVGVRGQRVKNVVRELHGEKIDIVEWSDDVKEFIENALSPAEIVSINIDKPNRATEVIVEDDQLSLAIGKKGQNVRLAAKLTGWKIDINPKSGEEDVEDEKEKVKKKIKEKLAKMKKDDLTKVEGLSKKVADGLANAGFKTVKSIAEASLKDLKKVPGIGPKKAEKIIEAAKKADEPEGEAKEETKESPPDTDASKEAEKKVEEEDKREDESS